MGADFGAGLLQGFADTSLKMQAADEQKQYRKLQEKLLKAQTDVMMAQAKREMQQQEALGRVQTRMTPTTGVDPRVFGTPDQQLDAGDGLAQQPALSLAEQLASAQFAPDVYAAFPELMGQQLRSEMDAQRMQQMMGMLSGVTGGGNYIPQPTIGAGGKLSVTMQPVMPVQREVTLPSGAKASVWERPPVLGGAAGAQPYAAGGQPPAPAGQPLITDPGPMGTVLGEGATKWTNDAGMAPPAGLTPAQAEAAGYRLKTDADVERAKGKVKADLDFASTAPGTIQAGEQALANIDALMNHPGMALGLGAIGGRLPPLAGEQADFVTRVEQLQGRAFLQAYENLRGGGPISETEGKKAEQAIARLNRAQDPAVFRQALSELRGIIASNLDRTRKRYADLRGAEPKPQPSAGAARIRFEDLPRRGQ